MASMQISTILNSYQLNANSQSLVQVAGDFFWFWKTMKNNFEISYRF